MRLLVSVAQLFGMLTGIVPYNCERLSHRPPSAELHTLYHHYHHGSERACRYEHWSQILCYPIGADGELPQPILESDDKNGLSSR